MLRKGNSRSEENRKRYLRIIFSYFIVCGTERKTNKDNKFWQEKEIREARKTRKGKLEKIFKNNIFLFYRFAKQKEKQTKIR